MGGSNNLTILRAYQISMLYNINSYINLINPRSLKINFFIAFGIYLKKFFLSEIVVEYNVKAHNVIICIELG